jgi:putative protease
MTPAGEASIQPEAPGSAPQKQPTSLPNAIGAEAQYEMEMAFSRGLFTGWFRGVDNRQLVHARFGTKRGVYLGEVTQIRNMEVAIKLKSPLKPGDGVVFDAGRPDKDEEGGRVYGVVKRGTEFWLSFGRDDVDFVKIHTGDKIWKTDDPELDRQVRQSFDGDLPRYCRPITIEVQGAAGQPMRLSIRDEQGRQIEAKSAEPLAQALKRPLDQQRLEEQLGRLGGTPFYLAELKNRLDGEVILPVSALNQLRRDFVKDLEGARRQPLKWTFHADADADAVEQKKCPAILQEIRKAPTEQAPTDGPQLTVLVRNMGQLAAALSCGMDTVYCDFEDPKLYADAVKAVAESGSCVKTPEIWIAPPRIFKPGEEWILKQIESAGADGYLIRNYDHLRYFAGKRCVGDYTFNIANAIGADWFIRRHKLERVTASYDLNEAQIGDLLDSAPAHWFEVVVHHHVPMFHMEHCVFCAFLSKGKDYHDCGRPCDKHVVELRDRVGARHSLKADAGCRNTVYNSLAQTGAEHLQQWLKLGLRHVRIDFLNESAADTAQTIAKYRLLMRGEISGQDVWRDLKALNRLGITRGAD